MDVTVAQDTPRGVFEIVVIAANDTDAKAIMMATPNISFNNGQFIREANPIHLMPGFIKLNLCKPLTVNLLKNDTLTCVL